MRACHFYFYDDFGKCIPILIFSLLHSQINCGRSCNKIYRLILNNVAVAKFEYSSVQLYIQPEYTTSNVNFLLGR